MVKFSDTGCESYHSEVPRFVGVAFLMDKDDFAGRPHIWGVVCEKKLREERREEVMS